MVLIERDEGKSLLIRADANVQMGTGHIMRCLALAQAWQDFGGHAIFVMTGGAPALEARLRSEKMGLVLLFAQQGSADDARQTADLAQEARATWVVVDGYHFDAEYQKIIKNAGQRLLFIDDNGHAHHYYADIVLNQNIYAGEELYKSRESYTQLLLGSRYVLLRREFWRWRGWKREIPQVARKVLVTMGGSDPKNVTLNVIEALQQVEVNGLNVVVVVGGSNPYYEKLQTTACDSQYAIRLESNVTNMPKLMAWADVAVSGGGSTCWELTFMGLPSLLLAVADNQRMAVSMLSEIGVALYLQNAIYRDIQCIALEVAALVKDREARAVMSQKSLRLIDGFGVARVLESLN